MKGWDCFDIGGTGTVSLRTAWHTCCKLNPKASRRRQLVYLCVRAVSCSVMLCCENRVLSCRPAWVPSAPAAPLYVVDPASLSDGDGSEEDEGCCQQLDPAARWRRCVSSGDQQQLLEFLAKGVRICTMTFLYTKDHLDII